MAKSISQLAPGSSLHFDSEEKRQRIMISVMNLLKIDDDEIIQTNNKYQYNNWKKKNRRIF